MDPRRQPPSLRALSSPPLVLTTAGAMFSTTPAASPGELYIDWDVLSPTFGRARRPRRQKGRLRGVDQPNNGPSLTTPTASSLPFGPTHLDALDLDNPRYSLLVASHDGQHWQTTTADRTPGAHQQLPPRHRQRQRREQQTRRDVAG